MGIMTERSCAVVQVDGIVFLCLLRGEALAKADAPFRQDDLSGSPLDGNTVIEVILGGEEEDFCWASIGPDRVVAPMSLLQAGIAAAITARLYGLAPGTGRLLGKELAATDVQVFIPPAGDWWTGTWAVETVAESPTVHDAMLVMHGEIVVRACQPTLLETAPLNAF